MKQHLLGILLAVAACFGVHHPTLAQNTKDIVDRLNTSLGVSLPSQYQTTVKNFVGNNRVLANKNANTFTEQFIKDQMKNSWGINKQNQLLFIWDAIYGQILNKQLYTGEDGNQKRLDEFEKVMEKAEACGKKYNEGFKAYMKQRSAEADRRSAEARQQSAEARQQSAEARQSRVITAYSFLYENIRFYTLRNVAEEEEIEKAKEYFKDNIKNCKEFKINYQSLLPTEVQRYYGVNPVQQNSLTCDKAIVQILNIGLQEIVNLYNIYQKAPQAKRKIRDFKDYIKDCKEHNIDYKSKLSPEIRRFFGVE